MFEKMNYTLSVADNLSDKHDGDENVDEPTTPLDTPGGDKNTPETQPNDPRDVDGSHDGLSPRDDQQVDEEEDDDSDSSTPEVVVVAEKPPPMKVMTTTTRAKRKRHPMHSMSFADRVEDNFMNSFQLAAAFNSGKITRPGIPSGVHLTQHTKDAYYSLWRESRKTLEKDPQNAADLWGRTIKAWCGIPHTGGSQWIEFADLEIVKFMIVMVFKGWVIPDTPDREHDLPAIVCSVDNGYAEVLFLTSLKLPELVETDEGEVVFQEDQLVTVSTAALLPASSYPLHSNKSRNFKSGYQVGDHIVPFAVCVASNICTFPSVWHVIGTNSYLVAVAGKTSKDVGGKEPFLFFYEDVRPLNLQDETVPLDYDTTTHKFRRILKRRWTQLCKEEDNVVECPAIKAGLAAEDW